MTVNTGTITITASKTGFSDVIKTFTVTKSKQGIQGETGAAGTNAKTVSLTAANYVITYDAAGNTPTPTGNLVLTATQQNFVTPRYRFTIDGLVGG
jgi:hypothetical protein